MRAASECGLRSFDSNRRARCDIPFHDHEARDAGHSMGPYPVPIPDPFIPIAVKIPPVILRSVTVIQSQHQPPLLKGLCSIF
jgi:hypothetical protein